MAEQRRENTGGDAYADALGFAEAVIATVREPLVVLEADLRVRTANRSFYRTFRVRPAVTEGQLLYDLGNGQWDIPALRRLLGEILPQNTAFEDFEVQHVFPDIGPKVMLLNARKLYREGNQTQLILLAIEDVTALREVERARRDAESRFTEMVRNVRDHSIFLTDPQGVITSWNVAAERIIGYTEADVVGRHYSLIFTPEDVRAGVPEHELRQAREEGRAEDERWHVRKDGTRFWALGIVTPLRDPQGRLSGFSKILRDMTAWKRADEAGRERERLLQLVTDTAPVFIAHCGADLRYRFVNKPYAERFNLRPRDIVGRTLPEVLGEAVFARIRPHVEAVLSGRRVEFEDDLPYDGLGTLSMRVAYEPELDASGRAVGLVAAIQNVTDRKRTEEALRASEERLRAIIDNSPSVIFVKDREGRYLLANRACEGYSGEPPERMLGKTDADFLPAEYAERFRADDLRVLRTGEVIRYEEAALLHGQAVTALTVKFPLRDAGGRPYAVCGIATDITELKRASMAVKESEERLRALSDNLPLGAVYQVLGDREGRRRFTYISAGVERLFGVTPAEAMADAAALYGLVHEEDRDRVSAAEQVALRDGTPFDCEFRSRTRSGGLVWVHARSAPRSLPTGQVVWEGIIVDVTARKTAERESEVYRGRLDLVVNSVDVGLWYCDLPFDRLVWNARVKEHFGLPPDADVTIGTFYERLHPDDRERTRQAIERSIRDHAGYDIEYRTVGLDGRERWLRAIGRTFYGADGQPVHFDGITVDVTEQVRQEQALKDADRRKDEFLATLAHELRNPLAPLRNGLQVMKLASGDAAAVEQARGMMERQLGQMVHLIDDLLDVSRITSGKLQLRKERVDLAGVVRSAVETARPLTEGSAHRLAVALPAEPVFLDADPVRLAQVFSNLLTNAAKYTDRGGRITLTAERHGGEVVVSVRDTGIGIAPEHLPRLFEMFSQVDSALERSQGGLGIGLSLVKGLVTMHGGGIEARSEGLGRGSEFVVRLPAAAGQASQRQQPVSGERAAARPRRRILIADDNRDAADSLAMMLRLAGHEVHAAYDGHEAAEAAAWFRPDIALLDIGMPRLNGYETARRIREEPWGKRVLLVATTGWGQEEDRRRASEAGFDHHLTKPVDPAALERLLSGTRVSTA